jgi:16S rRNA C1402 N4-methylase RsmH
LRPRHHSRGWLLGRKGHHPDGWSYRIFAPTAEETEFRAAALLRLLDGGLSKPIKRHFVAEGTKALEAARKEFGEVAKQSAEIRTNEESLARPSEISADILSQLKAQKVMVAIELSGLNARVKACDDMLKDPKRLEVSTFQSISDMKVKAEIERVGIKEKLD